MINDLVKHVKARLGAYHRKLELDDEAIIQCLEQETLKTLSVYFPYYLEWVLNTKESKVPELNNHYFLPNDIQGYQLMGVERVLPKFGQTQSTGLGSVYGGILPSINNFINQQLDQVMMSAMMVPNTFTFISPNILKLNGEVNFSNYQNMSVLLKVTHQKDFSTFPFGLRETIKKLALYDVCLDVFGIRNYFGSLNTTFGEIDLKLDVFQVEDKRDDLIEKLRLNQIKNARVKKIYVV